MNFAKRIKDLRERLGLSAQTLADHLLASGIRLDTLRRWERGSGLPSRDQAAALARAFGLRLDDLLDEDHVARPPKALFKLAGQPIDADARFAALGIAGLARESSWLDSVLGREPRSTLLRDTFAPDPTLGSSGQEYREGIRIAEMLRKNLQLGSQPIASMDRLIRERFSLWLTYSVLPRHVSGIALVDPEVVPTIVLNLVDRNENVWTRRFHAAHELCHVLFDRGKDLRIVMLDKFEQLGEVREARERRANAFAVHFLAPEAGMKELRKTFSALPLAAFARTAMEHFGLHFSAMIQHLRHTGIASNEEVDQLRRVDHLPNASWVAQERPFAVVDFPWTDVAPERRGEFARSVVEARKAAKITTSRAFEILGGGWEREFDELSEYFQSQPDPAESGTLVS